jgi:hypothetical protein
VVLLDLVANMHRAYQHPHSGPQDTPSSDGPSPPPISKVLIAARKAYFDAVIPIAVP